MFDYWFRFRIVIHIEENEYKTVCGVTTANNFTSAIENIENYYREELEKIELLQAITDSSGIFIFPSDKENIIDEIAESWIW